MPTQTDSLLLPPIGRPPASKTRLVLFVDKDFQLKTRTPDGVITALGEGKAGPQGATGEQGPQGEDGPEGPAGPAGEDGESATIAVGTVTTGAPGTDAAVTNVGTSSAAIFDFVIPRGDSGSGGGGGSVLEVQIFS